jgi:serine/threonine-protein kinase Chk2
LEDSSVVGRGRTKTLHDRDEIAVTADTRFIFLYPRIPKTRGFHQDYKRLQVLGINDSSQAYIYAEKATGVQHAVKVFSKRKGKTQHLDQEVAILMAIRHPNLLHVKDCYLRASEALFVLELAPKGDMFDYIVSKEKLTEKEARDIFRQLLEGTKYLVSSYSLVFALWTCLNLRKRHIA